MTGEKKYMGIFTRDQIVIGTILLLILLLIPEIRNEIIGWFI